MPTQVLLSLMVACDQGLPNVFVSNCNNDGLSLKLSKVDVQEVDHLDRHKAVGLHLANCMDKVNQ